ncbi:hypothetical protein [Saccharopolyspora terrae]|nr:hypothetical protein [Saccharopolyspora terrae]
MPNTTHDTPETQHAQHRDCLARALPELTAQGWRLDHISETTEPEDDG